MNHSSVHNLDIQKKLDRENALREIASHAPKDVSPLITPAAASLVSLQAEESLSQKKFHRLAEIRDRQMISLSAVAEHLAVSVAEVRRQENPETDLHLSQLYLWRDILETSVGELIIEPEDIPSNPIRTRCQLVKVMKTARSIFEGTKEKGTEILANQLIEELTELMPELADVAAWPTVGQSREPKSPGQAVLRRFDNFIARQLEE
ncbi:hypothetical protein FACS18942_07240 [Planctomycetales bacterium]|nr:hypothetical protein FACS18942_07240 [Planctomycetales bacterium]